MLVELVLHEKDICMLRIIQATNDRDHGQDTSKEVLRRFRKNAVTLNTYDFDLLVTKTPKFQKMRYS